MHTHRLEGMDRSGEAPAFDLITTFKSLIADLFMVGLQIFETQLLTQHSMLREEFNRAQ